MILARAVWCLAASLARGIAEDVLVIVGARSRGSMRGTWRWR